MPYLLPKKSLVKSLTQALWRHIIGVAPEQINCTEAKNKQDFKNSTRKQPLLAGGCFLCLITPILKRKIPICTMGIFRLVELRGTAPRSKR